MYQKEKFYRCYFKKKKCSNELHCKKHQKARSECGITALSPSPWRSARLSDSCPELSLTPLTSPADASPSAAIKRCSGASPSSFRCAEAHLQKGSGEAGSAPISHQPREQVQPQQQAASSRQQAEWCQRYCLFTLICPRQLKRQLCPDSRES